MRKTSPKTSPKTSHKTKPKTSPTKTPAKKSKTADEIRKLVRAGVTGDGAVAIAELSSPDAAPKIRDWVSTQSLALDGLLETPGLPCGRIVEVHGKNHSGKTTLVAHLIAEVQRRGGVAYLADQDNTADAEYFKAIGVDVDRLEMIECATRDFESIVEAIEKTIDELRKFDTLAVIVWDDIAAVETRHDLAADFGKVQPGGVAKGIRGMCRRLLSKLAKTRILLVVTNQTYSKVGMVFGNPEVAFGGDGFGIFASVRLHMKASGRLPAEAAGTLVKAKCVKSKVSKSTHKDVVLAIGHGRGFDNVYTIVNLLEEKKLIANAGRTQSVRLSETEELRWTGGWLGLVSKCVQDPTIYLRLQDAYRALSPIHAIETLGEVKEEEEPCDTTCDVPTGSAPEAE